MAARQRRLRSRPRRRSRDEAAARAQLRRWELLAAPALLAATLLLFAGTLAAGFVHDDHSVLAESARLDGGGLLELVRSWSRPVRALSVALDRTLFGAEPLGYHLHSLLWHAFCVWLVRALLLRLTGRAGLSFLGALLFAVHPVHVEAVASVANRKELLCLAFSLLACLAYARAAGARAGRRWRLGVAAALCWLLALFSKQVAVALPLSLVAYDLLFLPREQRLLARRALPLAAAAGLAALCVALAVRARLDLANPGSIDTLAGYAGEPSFASLILTAAPGFWRYAALLFWPARLCPDHVVTLASSPLDPTVLLAWLALLGVLVAAPLLARRNRLAGFGLLWVLIHWLPVSNLVPSAYLLADRYLYVPSVGFCLLTVAAGDALTRRLRSAAPRLARPALAGLAVLVLTACAVRTLVYLPHWRDDRSLWGHTVRCEPRSWRAHNNAGNYALVAGDAGSAVTHLSRALALRPGLAAAHFNRGNAFYALRDYAAAIRDYDAALAGLPDPATVLHARALARLELGQAEAALRDFERALELAPERADTWLGRGLAAAASGAPEQALASYRQALTLEPGNRRARAALAAAGS